MALTAPAPAANDEDWAYLDNGEVRIGIIKSSGGGIGYFSLSGSDRNLLDHWDRGRLVQQSYYGEKDGSMWVDKPWRWNPVQGGDYHGNPAKLLELKVDDRSIYTKTLPKHWASGADIAEMTMEQWITLSGAMARVHFKMTYDGDASHPATTHEVPAIFIASDLYHFARYDGPDPWSDSPLTRVDPGWPNQHGKSTERWAAYYDDKGFGVGAYVPVTDQLTFYCYGKPGERGACSYFAPVTTFPIQKGTVFEYDVFITAGPVDRIREAFRKLARTEQPKPVASAVSASTVQRP